MQNTNECLRRLRSLLTALEKALFFAWWNGAGLQKGKTASIYRLQVQTRKPNLGDQYQVVAYATHRDIRTTHAGLVYPSNGQGEDVSPTMQNLDIPQHRWRVTCILALRIDSEGIREEFQHGHFLNNLQACLDETQVGEEDE